ncbi:MAG: oxidoreductase [Candidatus Lambdaproteobacteria bacterium]|nr:oxidoreductase [Candidatus Lambdaproteobacteria bacterium]
MKPTMQAYVLEGTPDAITGAVKGFETARLPAGEVTIRVAFSSVNYKDAMVAHGQGRMVRQFPHIPGIDLSGEVVADASGRFKPGAPVLVTGFAMGVGHCGGFAEYARVPVDWVVPLPAGLTAHEAMALGTAGFTAMLCVMALERNGLRPEQGPVLVTGATGGVGSLSVDILAKAGYRVVASSGKADMKPWLATLGAAEVLNREQVTDGSGKVLLKETWAAAVDSVGGATLEYLLRTTQWGGSVALCGLVQNANFTATVYPFILRGVNLLGVDTSVTPMALRLAAWARLAGPNKPPHLAEIGRTIALADLPRALAEIIGGGARGRYVVKIAG